MQTKRKEQSALHQIGQENYALDQRVLRIRNSNLRSSAIMITGSSESLGGEVGAGSTVAIGSKTGNISFKTSSDLKYLWDAFLGWIPSTSSILLALGSPIIWISTLIASGLSLSFMSLALRSIQSTLVDFGMKHKPWFPKWSRIACLTCSFVTVCIKQNQHAFLYLHCCNAGRQHTKS